LLEPDEMAGVLKSGSGRSSWLYSPNYAEDKFSEVRLQDLA
jgi:hypothetical protein